MRLKPSYQIFKVLLLIVLLINLNYSAIKDKNKYFLRNIDKKNFKVSENNELFDSKYSQLNKIIEISGYLFYGYNLYRGNPHPLSESIDTGFTNQIFFSNHTNGVKTGETKSNNPSGFTFAKNIGCDVTMSTKEIKGLSNYSATLETDVSFSGDFAGIAFSASPSYKQIDDGLKKSKTIYIESKADCIVYKGQIEYYAPPLFYRTFLMALKYLGEKDFEKNNEDFFIFIDNYGTHFVDTIYMGARYGYMHKMSFDEYNQMSSPQIQTSLNASVNGPKLSDKSEIFTIENLNSNINSSSNIETKIISIGFPPPANGDSLAWASSAIKEPMPIRYKLRPLIDIFNNPLFNLSQLIKEEGININFEKLRENMKKAYEKYCIDYLIKKNAVQFCSPLNLPIELNNEKIKPLEVKFDGSMNISFKNLNSNTCLTFQEYKVIASACDKKDPAQKLRLIYTPSTITYKILFKNINNNCFDKPIPVDKPAIYPTSVLLSKCHAGNNQQFRLIKKDFNIYQLILLGECLNIRDKDLGNNAPLGFEPCMDGEKNQLWRAIKV